MLDKIIAKIQNEPVLVRTLLGAVLTLLIKLGVPMAGLETPIMAVAVALLALSARSAVIPMRKVEANED